MRIRRGGEADLPLVLGMLDGAVEWLVAQGRTGQWGTEPWSARPKAVERARSLVTTGTPWIAEIDGVPAGALVLRQWDGGSQEYVPPAGEPEVYVHLLVTDRRFAGRGVGAALLDHAVAQARRAGVGLVRVDCYAGGDGRLVEFYRRCGFTPVVPFTAGESGDWPGMLLAQRVDQPDSP